MGEVEDPKRREKTLFEKGVCIIKCIMVTPVEAVRRWVVQNQKESAWYQQKFRRVPNIDECDEDEPVCYSEANFQYKRDRLVDSEIMAILRQRFESCVNYERPHHLEKCAYVLQEYEKAENNWFIKYGDLGGYHNVLTCYMKQKHRLLWERRYGEVGTGMDCKEEILE